MFKKILCPTDFSAPSRAALRMARDLAAHHDAELVLMTVVEVVPVLPSPRAGSVAPTFDVSSYQKEIRENAAEQLEKLAAELRTDALTPGIHVADGTAADEIIDYAQQGGVDLIVIATHGRSGVSRFLFGSVAERVLRSSSCPVLTIRLEQS